MRASPKAEAASSPRRRADASPGCDGARFGRPAALRICRPLPDSKLRRQARTPRPKPRPAGRIGTSQPSNGPRHRTYPSHPAIEFDRQAEHCRASRRDATTRGAAPSRATIARPRPPRRAQCGAAAGAVDDAGVPARPASSLTRILVRATPRARRGRRVRRARRCAPARFGSHRPRRRRSMRLRTPRPADTRDCRRRRARRRLRTRPARPSPRRDGRRSVRASAQGAPRRRQRQRLARLAPGAVPYPAPAGYPLAPPRCTAAPKTPELRAALTRPPQPSPAARVRGSRSPRPPLRRFRRRPAPDRCRCRRRRSPDRAGTSRGRVRS